MCCLKLPSLTLPRLTMNLWSMASSSQSNTIHVWKGLHLDASYEQHINLHTSGLYYVNIRAWTKILEAVHKKLKHREGDKAFLLEAKLQLKPTLARFFSVFSLWILYWSKMPEHFTHALLSRYCIRFREVHYMLSWCTLIRVHWFSWRWRKRTNDLWFSDCRLLYGRPVLLTWAGFNSTGTTW